MKAKKQATKQAYTCTSCGMESKKATECCGAPVKKKK